MAQDKKHSTVVIWFKSRGADTQMTLHNTTIDQAWVKAEEFGWQRPVWYKPWLYLQLHGYLTYNDRDLCVYSS